MFVSVLVFSSNIDKQENGRIRFVNFKQVYLEEGYMFENLVDFCCVVLLWFDFFNGGLSV